MGAIVLRVPERDEIPTLVARIARLWAELHEADPELALRVAAGLPHMTITRSDR